MGIVADIIGLGKQFGAEWAVRCGVGWCRGGGVGLCIYIDIYISPGVPYVYPLRTLYIYIYIPWGPYIFPLGTLYISPGGPIYFPWGPYIYPLGALYNSLGNPIYIYHLGILYMPWCGVVWCGVVWCGGGMGVLGSQRPR